MKLKYIVLLVLLQFGLGCGKKATNGQEEKAVTAADTNATAKDVITLTKEQMDAVGITVGKVEMKNLTSVVKASGQLAVPPQNRAEVNVLFGGIVRHIHVLEGQNVHKGQSLVVIENADFIKLQQDYLAAKNGFSFVAAEYQRQQELKAADAGTGKVFQQAEANYHAEKGRIAGYEKQLQQIGINPSKVAAGNITRDISITAPISGTVAHIAVNTGTFAQPGTSLMEIVDNSNIHADLNVFEKDLFKVRNGQTVRFLLTNQNNQEIQGEIYGVNKSFEGDTRGIIVHAAIRQNKFNLIPGMYVTALIDIGKNESTAVPNEAIVRSEGKDYVFIQTETKGEERSFKMLEVATGLSELGYVQITALEELPANATIITRGAFYVLSKTQGGEEE